MGFSIAAPVGPIGILCIRRTMAENRLTGLVTGLGAASADALYGIVAAMGLTAISSLLLSQQKWLGLVGGGFLIYLGFTMFRARAPISLMEQDKGGAWQAYLSAFFLTRTKPMTLLFFTAVFAGLGLGEAAGEDAAGAWLVLGVFIGSAFWWLLLTGSVAMFKDRFKTISLVWINRVAGFVLLAFGILALVQASGRF